MWRKLKPYVIAVAIALGVGGLSAFLTRDNMALYNEISKPVLAPPMIVFPVAWGILFVLMGISSAIVYTEREKNKRAANEALRVYVLQLIINFFWTIIFFNMRAFLFAFIWIVLLWIFIVAMIVEFKKINSLAAYLQIPYLFWVSFAGYLTLMVYLLNK